MVSVTLPRSLLFALPAVPLALGGACSSEDDQRPEKPDAAWAKALCERVLNDDYEVLRARPVSAKAATDLYVAAYPSDASSFDIYHDRDTGEAPDYLASCKVKILVPTPDPLPPDGAVLVGENGSNAFVSDDF